MFVVNKVVVAKDSTDIQISNFVTKDIDKAQETFEDTVVYTLNSIFRTLGVPKRVSLFRDIQDIEYTYKKDGIAVRVLESLFDSFIVEFESKVPNELIEDIIPSCIADKGDINNKNVIKITLDELREI